MLGSNLDLSDLVLDILQNLTTKATIKQCKYYSNSVKVLTFLITRAPVHDGNNGIMTLIFT